jgi:hypothetical protein
MKRVYLDAGLATPNPTPDQQEMARAFVTLAHAEFEYFAEEVFRGLSQASLNGAASGVFGRPAIALLAFSGLDSLKGGTFLSSGPKKVSRKLSTRIGSAHGEFVQLLDSNNGIREKHLASMAVPVGLDASAVDNTWLNDLEAFCSSRGAFAHMSRTTQRGSHLAVNPADVWRTCKRLVWTDPALAAQGVVNSFESLDLWVETEKQSFASSVAAPPWRLKLSRYFARRLLARRRWEGSDDDDD